MSQTATPTTNGTATPATNGTATPSPAPKATAPKATAPIAIARDQAKGDALIVAMAKRTMGISLASTNGDAKVAAKNASRVIFDALKQEMEDLRKTLATARTVAQALALDDTE
jgi:hypothetical protein